MSKSGQLLIAVDLPSQHLLRVCYSSCGGVEQEQPPSWHFMMVAVEGMLYDHPSQRKRQVKVSCRNVGILIRSSSTGLRKASTQWGIRDVACDSRSVCEATPVFALGPSVTPARY